MCICVSVMSLECFAYDLSVVSHVCVAYTAHKRNTLPTPRVEPTSAVLRRVTAMHVKEYIRTHAVCVEVDHVPYAVAQTQTYTPPEAYRPCGRSRFSNSLPPPWV